MTRHISEASPEKLRELSGPGGPVAMRWCERCDQHYGYCKCPEPVWRLRSDGKLGPLPGEPGGPRTLTDFLGGGT